MYIYEELRERAEIVPDGQGPERVRDDRPARTLRDVQSRSLNFTHPLPRIRNYDPNGAEFSNLAVHLDMHVLRLFVRMIWRCR